MNYYSARQHGKDGPWHFTRRNDDRVWPEGCTTSCEHASPEEACQHYVDLQVAEGVRHGSCSWTTCVYADCANPAQQVLSIGGPNGHDYPLCDTHATNSVAVVMFRAEHEGAFEIVSSY